MPARDVENHKRGRLSHSRMSDFRTCPRKHYLKYVCGIRREKTERALRFGISFHKCLGWYYSGATAEQVVERLRLKYANPPSGIGDPAAWYLECEIVLRLFYGYVWRWGADGLKIVATELRFELPIINPDTGARTPSYTVAGVIDRIVRMPGGRVGVLETKTTSDAVGPDSDWWKRFRMDQQVTLYFWAARQLGYEVQFMLGDVIHKPGIAPREVADLDDKGIPIVCDSAGMRVFKRDGTPRTSPDRAKGYVAAKHIETRAEFGKRLTNDIEGRSDFYFARQEVARLDSDVDWFLHELWQQQLTIRQAERTGRHYRNTNACVSPYRCEMLDICEEDLTPESPVPDGFCRIVRAHSSRASGSNDAKQVTEEQ